MAGVHCVRIGLHVTIVCCLKIRASYSPITKTLKHPVRLEVALAKCNTNIPASPNLTAYIFHLKRHTKIPNYEND